MNRLIILSILFFAGCNANKPSSPSSPIPLESYDTEVLNAKAEALGMKYEEYLQALKSGQISRLRRGVVFYQAYDHNWADDPSINPVFSTKAEAEEYAQRNNMNKFQDGHSYVVREVDYRYEVRQVNDAINDLLYTSLDYNDAYEYVVQYSSSHSDLIIYDLKTGKRFEETP